MTQLLRGDPRDLTGWLDQPDRRRIWFCVGTILLGCGLHGFTLGFWRAPLMGGYVAIKMPLLIFVTLACNGLLNGLLGILLGSGLGMRQSLLAQLMSFSIAALLLGSLAPVMMFLSVNVPPPESPEAATAHAGYLLAHTCIIAGAGVLSQARLIRLLRAKCPDARTARRTFVAWIAGNAFVGAQFSWILRPFFGTPHLPVAFLREDPFRGTFYETVWRSAGVFLGSPVWISLFLFFLPFVLFGGLIAAVVASTRHMNQHTNTRKIP